MKRLMCHREPTTYMGTGTATAVVYIMREHLCPDLLRYEQIGEADNLRGRVVRAFFWVLRAWRVKR